MNDLWGKWNQINIYEHGFQLKIVFCEKKEMFVFSKSMNKLAWKPSVSLIVTPAVYPHLALNYDFKHFFPIKVDPLNLESQNQTKFPNQYFRPIGQGVHELWSDIQTSRDNNFIYM